MEVVTVDVCTFSSESSPIPTAATPVPMIGNGRYLPGARDDLAADDGRDEEPAHHRRELETRARRAAAAHDLEEERQECDRAEERDADDEPDRRADDEDAAAEERQWQDRLLRALLDEREEHEQRDAGDAHDDDLRRAPRIRVPTEARQQNEGREPTCEQRRAEVVDDVVHPIGGRVERRADDDEREHSDGQVDVEDPPPREVVDEEPSDERADDGRDAEDCAEEPLVPAAIARRDDVPDHRDRDDDEAAGTEPLQCTERDELGHVSALSAQRGADEEDDDRRLDHDLAAVQVAELPVQRPRDRRRQQVRGHHPRQV